MASLRVVFAFEFSIQNESKTTRSTVLTSPTTGTVGHLGDRKIASSDFAQGAKADNLLHATKKCPKPPKILPFLPQKRLKN